MGITIVQKSDLKKNKKGATKALILAGGAVTGGSFMAGGVKALNDYMTNYSVNDFNLYVGISSGSLLAAPLIGGVKPEEILKSLDGTSKRFSELAPWHFYWPNLREIFTRPIGFWLLKMPKLALDLVAGIPSFMLGLGGNFKRFAKDPNEKNYEALMQSVFDLTSEVSLPSLMSLIPSGLFDNAPIEEYLRENIRKNHMTNSFQVTEKVIGKRLYISAMNVDKAERVVFGPDEKNDITISQAVQASTAMPIFYKPARINGVDYVDGGVLETAHIDVAIKKGAKLIICYNPFRPYDNKVFLKYVRKENKYVSKDERLSDNGVMAIINQIFRALFHSRLHVAMEHYKNDPKFKGDIILVEPRADDAAFFGLNPLALSNRVRAGALGYKSVRDSIEEKYKEITRILGSYGIKMSRENVEAEIGMIVNARNDEKNLREIIEHDPSEKKTKKKKKSSKKRK